MTIEAMKRALEALENWAEYDPDNVDVFDTKAMSALRTAIEQADHIVDANKTMQEPVSGYYGGHVEAMKQWAEGVSKAYDLTAWGHTERAAEILRKTRDAIRTAIEEAEKQEPVAWMHPKWPNYTGHTSPVTTYMVDGWTPLYTTPQAAPVQEENLYDLAVKADNGGQP